MRWNIPSSSNSAHHVLDDFPKGNFRFGKWISMRFSNVVMLSFVMFLASVFDVALKTMNPTTGVRSEKPGILK